MRYFLRLEDRWHWPIAALALLLLVGLGCSASDSYDDKAGNGDSDTDVACTVDGDCEVGSICEDGRCEVAVCPDIFDPVCGVDGKTYGNACEARAAHVEVAHPGECPAICGGIQGLTCPEGQICDYAPGFCQGADLQGTCVTKPEVCTKEFDPVCGCDGVTYGNDCMRLVAGVQKDHDGECEATS